MNRRKALKMAGIGSAAVGAGAPMSVMSAPSLSELSRALAGKRFYTTDHPGRWKGKAAGHAPRVKVEEDGADQLVKIVTPHPMTVKHHITKHMLLDRDLNLIGESVFDVSFDLPQSRFVLSGDRGRLYALSVCNLHDTWIAEANI